uniref:Choline dehydrogenase n=1 Tax=Rhipicephalus appendiculatus TaxID=34631 RepID=A0A131YW73_RHIAP
MSCTLWGRGAAPQNAIGLLLAMVNLVTHVPFTDLPNLRDYQLGELRKQYDYVIVGGGAAGCVIANRLSADPNVTVLLLEAGGLETAPRQIPGIAGLAMGGHDDWAYWTVQQRNACLSYRDQRCPLPRGKVLGGSSVLTSMLYVRGNRHDYDRWEQEYGAKGWAYKDVLPHFRKIEDYRVGRLDEFHGSNGEVPVDYANTSTPLSDIFLEACQQAGYAVGDYNGHKQSGCSRLQTNVKEGERVSASKAFIEPIIGARENLHVAPFSQATKVVFEGSRAVGVQFTRFGEQQQVSARLEVVLSAGSVGSAHLLLLSGIGPKKDLQRLQIPVVADLPVGRSLQDHPLFLTALQTSRDNVGIPPYSLDDIAEYDRNRSGTISIPAGIEALQFLSSGNADESGRPNIQVTLISSSPATQVDRALHLNIGILPEDYDSYYGPRMNKPGFRVSFTNNRPKSRGQLTLRSTDPNEYPDINPAIFQHPDDIKAAARGAKVFIDRMLNTTAMKSIGAKPWGVIFAPCRQAGPPWSEGYIECLLRHWAYPSWHTCCTVPMGSHAGAVLDERLRVRGGVTGLRVADASVMPGIVSGNTNAPTMMIGSKAAAMIIEDNRPQRRKPSQTFP